MFYLFGVEWLLAYVNCTAPCTVHSTHRVYCLSMSICVDERWVWSTHFQWFQVSHWTVLMHVNTWNKLIYLYRLVNVGHRNANGKRHTHTDNITVVFDKLIAVIYHFNSPGNHFMQTKVYKFSSIQFDLSPKIISEQRLAAFNAFIT